MDRDTATSENALIQAWLDALKVALLSKDDQKAYELTQNLPQNLEFQNLDTQMQARDLIAQVIELLKERKQHAKHSMQQIKAARAFLES